MKRSLVTMLLASAMVSQAEDSVVQPKVESVGLFKNGLCVVKCSFAADHAGSFIWNDPPRAVHGTFFVESDAPVTVQSTTRKVNNADKAMLPTGILQTDLAGAEVKLLLTSENGAPGTTVTGKIWSVPQPKPDAKVWNTQYSSDPYGYSRMGYNQQNPAAPPTATTGNYLVLEGKDGTRQYIGLGRIGQVEIVNPGPAREQLEDKHVTVFTVAKPGVVNVSYLTKGASWAPGYFVDLTDAKTLKLRQTAVVKNELMALKDVDLQLISGFPNVEFSHVDSPLWQGTTLAGFFQQVSQKPGAGGSGMITQNAMMYNSGRAESVPLPELKEAGATSQDLHFESLGRRSLEAGDALALDVASGETSYERVVEWTVVDKRDPWGRWLEQALNGKEGDGSSEAWDSVIFQNPLKFPMTTASATIREKGEFRGQSQSNWTNPGQRSCLHITKALSLQTYHSEIEESGKREQEIWVGGRRYYRATVKAEATMKNYRSTATTVLLRAQFSGDLIEADQKPADTLRREGVYSVNQRHELEWKLSLDPGAEKKLVYRYTVLVAN